MQWLWSNVSHNGNNCIEFKTIYVINPLKQTNKQTFAIITNKLTLNITALIRNEFAVGAVL